jgi:hypothetical protein
MSDLGIEHCMLLDDGTLDTVVEVTCPKCDKVRVLRYSDTSEYRDSDGALDEDRFFEEVVLDDFESDHADDECDAGDDEE